MNLVEVREGATTLRVPEAQAGPSAGPSQAGLGFYNSSMALTRDLTVLAARAFEPSGRPEFLDGLAATGARGLRVANEADGWLVTLNDRSRRTAEIAEANAEALGLGERAVVRAMDLNALLAGSTWPFVEIDPYGSPVPFLSLAVRAVEDGGILALTATDTTALHGVKAKPGRRRYLGEPPSRDAPGWKAAASRYLVGSIVREAARFDRAVSPLLVHHHKHAIRAYVRVERGADAADRALGRLEEIVLCPTCRTWDRQACACGEGRPTGPYEMAPLHDPAFLEALEVEVDDELARPDAVRELLTRCTDEAELGPFYLDIDPAVKARGLGGPPARDDLQAALEDAGIPNARTHYGPNTLAYDGDPRDVMAVLAEQATGS